jgi:ABC-type glycerol-3-phosphate transport system permease component
VLSEEQLADYHSNRLHKLTFSQTLASLLVLSIGAAVVILPFAYMLLISLKGPAEVGNGRLLPDELENFRTGRTAWIEVLLPAENAASVSDMNSIPVFPADAVTSAPTPPGRLPTGIVSAKRLAIQRLDSDDNKIRLLLEAPDPSGDLARGGAVNIYLPAAHQTWQPVEGTVHRRTIMDVASRLLINYQRLLNWDMLQMGKLLDWLKGGYPRWYFNSLFVAVCTVVLGVFLDSLAAFGFAKFRFPFKRVLFALLIATLMIPYPVTLVPTFFLFAKLGFYNTYLALVIPGVVSAFGIFLVRQYMETIPDDMLDAARVDGAGDFQVYWKVVLPAARPVLAALAVFRFIFQWNSYLYPLVLTNKDSMKTVQLGIATMEDMHGTVDYGLQMAGSAMAVMPILVVYMFAQKHFIAGITMGSSKG